jgi:hypothetical protein
VGESRKDGLGPLGKFPVAIRPFVPEEKAELAEYEIDESVKVSIVYP